MFGPIPVSDKEGCLVSRLTPSSLRHVLYSDNSCISINLLHEEHVVAPFL